MRARDSAVEKIINNKTSRQKKKEPRIAKTMVWEIMMKSKLIKQILPMIQKKHKKSCIPVLSAKVCRFKHGLKIYLANNNNNKLTRS